MLKSSPSKGNLFVLIFWVPKADEKWSKSKVIHASLDDHWMPALAFGLYEASQPFGKMLSCIKVVGNNKYSF